MLHGLITALSQGPGFSQVKKLVAERGTLDIQIPEGARPATLAALAGAHGADSVFDAATSRPLVVVTATGREAEELEEALGAYDDAEKVAVLPSWETLPHERLSPRSDTMARRIAVFRRLAHPEPRGPHGPIRILIVPTRSLLQYVIPGLGEREPVTVKKGDIIAMEEVESGLVQSGYSRVDMVEHRGEFAVRGGILDVFAPTDPHPLRLDFFGDEVEEIREFSVADQRTFHVARHGLWAPAARELLLSAQVRAAAADLLPRLPGAADLLGKITEGIPAEGMESLAQVLVPRMDTVLDLVEKDRLVVVLDPERVRRRAFDLLETTQEFAHAAWAAAAEGAQVPISLPESAFLTLDQSRRRSLDLGLGWWSMADFGLDETAQEAEEEQSAVARVRFASQDAEKYRGDISAALATMKQRAREQWRQVLITAGKGMAERLVEQLSANDIAARLVDDVINDPEPSVIYVTCAPGVGFTASGLKLSLLSESDLTGKPGASTRDMRKMPTRRRRNAVDPLQLKAGDFVVHETHGVGKFVELLQRSMGVGKDRAVREYLVIEYAPSKRGQPGDRLYVPTDSLDQVTKYVGGESPQLSKMGGSDWAKAKGKARKAVKQIAGELVRLYSARMASPGYTFGPDTPWQRELEEAFAYVETPDQLVTIDEVKQDMEKSIPMDRLICGDVGYGKTEIAVRAAFKAVQDGKQVAVLVPTTLLVAQHLETFSERYAPFPVTVKPLSRFQSKKENDATKEEIAQGGVDVVIGTHSLLTGDVRFKDLGLVIIDEEQRFGVEHKETLKALRTNVDVLSMSATPIPRTLEMAVSGIREMSTLATPPEERHPVLTYVGAYDPGQIRAAIRRELLRDGQVFFIHNRVADIDATAKQLADLIPEARIAVAHGKMSEGQLERVMVDFWEREFDVLVCTTIVETGLDIPNANTLIVDRADRFGLSQLHQLRGRVGRSRERAYAYFLYPRDMPLTETAHDRLATIAANTDLGAGMAVAMKDLEIRGAGNLLGGEQAGHIEGVGFDLYIRMVSEAVTEYRGDQPQPNTEVKIELPIDAHIPRSYIDGDRLRLEAYTKLATASGAPELERVRAELSDRYGRIPARVEALFGIAQLRQEARAIGLEEITMQGKFVRFFPVELQESAQMRLRRLHPGSVVKPAVRTVLVPLPKPKQLGAAAPSDTEVLQWVSGIIGAVFSPSVSMTA